MSKKVKNRAKKYQAAADFTDFTINECANSVVPVPVLIGKKKQFVECNSTKKLVELAERNEREILENSNENLPESCEATAKKIQKNVKKTYADYCIDVWWLISKHIMPEDVLRFALICRKTACVVSMEKFWSHLYRRFYTRTAELPSQLQPRLLGKQEGLRNAVIRSLFYTYPPFKASLPQRTNRDPVCLVGKRLESSWFVQKPREELKWTFIYTFRPRTYKEKRKIRLEEGKGLKSFPAENSHFLLISTRQFRPLPQFYGHDVFLKALTRPLATGFSKLPLKALKPLKPLKLTFEDYKRDTVQTITYEGAVFVQVIDWFSPLYETVILKLCDFEKGE
ncbi:transmembrane protein 183-like [Phlebotomus papatasi]|uniref:transmembrane protein 183-like n=1 Tax=Phlebotomus papatasi TaxID=29031 RepID=UPI0024845479|nr:transmembrane protein 183-like [Phlebotomus papatasi]